jgi:hypothetical protein
MLTLSERIKLADFVRNNLKVEVVNKSEPPSCGGEVDGHLAVCVRLLMKDLLSGEWQTVSEDETVLE